jgi:hypothetical protein
MLIIHTFADCPHCGEDHIEVGFSVEMIETGEFCFEHAPAHIKDDMIYSFPSRVWNSNSKEEKEHVTLS